MSLVTSEEQRAVCEAIAAWASAQGFADAARARLDKPGDESGDSWSVLFGQLAEFGVFGAAVADDQGGLGATFADAAAMIEQCGHDLVPGPIGATVATAIGLARSADPRAASLLESVLAGEVVAAVPASAYTGASVIDGGTVELGLVPGYVDGCVLTIPLAGADGALSWQALAPGSVAVTAATQSATDGATPVARVSIAGVDTDDLLPLGGDAIVSGVLHAALAAYQSGVCRWALDTAVGYAKMRTQFGSAIGSFQAVKHICADMLCRSEQVTSVAWDLARAVDDALAGGDDALAGGDDATSQLELSVLATDVIVAQSTPGVTKDCIQVLGGIGFTYEHPAHLYLRSALAAAVLLGHAHDQAVALAGAGLAGARRAFDVDLSAVENQRDKVRVDVAHLAEVSGDERRHRLADSGYLMPHWPQPYGLAASPALQLLIDTELDAAGVVRPDLVIAGWAIPTILQHGTDAQRERFVAPTLAGDIVWCQMFSEPEAGSDLASLRTKAVRVDGGWSLTGQKIWTSQAHNAQWAICLARTDFDVAKHKGITYFLVDMSSPGLDVRPLREATGHPKFNEVFLDGVFVPDDCVVGDIGGGWRLARTTLANERVAMGGSGLGKEMDALLRQIDGLGRDLTTGELQTFGRLFADSHVGRVLDARAVTAQLAGLDPGSVSSVRKLIGVQHRQSVPDFALELSGFDALTWPESTEQVIQNRCLSIAGGTTQILRTAAAERILGLPRG